MICFLGATTMHLIRSFGISIYDIKNYVKILLNYGADMDAKDNNGNNNFFK